MRRSPNEHSLLGRLNSPSDLRRLPREKLPALANELRQFLTERVSIPAADLTASLGAVELAVALHYVYRTPQDRLVWDGSQQMHAHRVLTGRRPRLHAVRGKGQLTATARGADSKYEHFAVGHASTSISAALGMAIAASVRGERRHVVAILGENALNAGMVFEALNHAGSLPSDLLVILNDERDCLTSAGGLLSAQFARAFAGPWYGQLREGGKRMLQQMPTMRELARRSEKHLKGMVLPGTLFEEMGFNYTGPVDRQDVKGLVRTLQNLQRLRGAQFLHIAAHPGKRRRAGAPAARARNLTAASAADVPAQCDPCSHALGRWACAQAVRAPQLVCISTAPAPPPGLAPFAARFPERYFRIAGGEQHALTFAAGLAAEGQRPLVALSASLLQRGYDQLIHDIALQRLPVLLVLDGSGLSAPRAPHQGGYALSYLRCIPGLCIAVPADAADCARLLAAASALAGPAVVHLPAASGLADTESVSGGDASARRAELRREGRSGLALLVFGALLESVRRTAERLDATLVNMRFVKPLDAQLIRSLCVQHHAFVTIEENVLAGGAGSAAGELLRAQRRAPALLHLGMPERVIEQGTYANRLAAAGLDAGGLSTSIERWWHAQQQQRVAAGA